MPDLARASKDDPQFYTGSLWLMATGSWKVRVDVDGARGTGRCGACAGALHARARHAEGTGRLPDPARPVLVVGIVSMWAPACARRSWNRRQPDRRAHTPARMVMLATRGRCWRRALARQQAGGTPRPATTASYVYKPLGARRLGGDGNRLRSTSTIPAGSIGAPTICCPTTTT